MYCSLHNLASARRRPGHSHTHTFWWAHTLLISFPFSRNLYRPFSLSLLSSICLFSCFFFGWVYHALNNQQNVFISIWSHGRGLQFRVILWHTSSLQPNILAQFTFVRPLKRMRLFTLNEWRARIANVQRTLLAQIMLSSVLALALRMHSIHYRAVIVHIACR